MTISPSRPLLPLLSSGPHGSRSNMTCTFRCGNACDHPEPNPTDNRHIQDEIATALARRSLLKGAAAVGGASLVASIAVPELAAAAVAGSGSGLSTMGFAKVIPNKRDAVVTAEGFTSEVLIAWGDRVTADAPAFNANAQTPEAQQKQFGYNCDYVGVLPIPGKPNKAALVVNHEYTDEVIMFPTGKYDSATTKRIAMAAHGLSVVEIKRGAAAGSWLRVTPANAPLNRRIHTNTLFKLVGPAAGDARLKTTADPTGTKVRGTLNNCAGGTTPWGTVLSGEENFNQYFDKSDTIDETYAASYARYGITGSGSRGWSEVETRFDLTQEPHEPFRFGWIVEIDPLNPTSTPRKHTMLGRFKHEGANVVISKYGKAVAYMGDDERGDYMYKFVSRDKYDDSGTAAARTHNKTLLEHGTLYVAKFTGDGTEDGQYDGTGSWRRLCTDTTSYVADMTVADVLIDTRLAADKVAPTKMDRPEDVEPNPVNGKVYAALTNNSNRGTSYPADEANPLTSSMVRAALGEPLASKSGNRNGYVLELTPTNGNHASTSFTWDLMLVCGDPDAPETYFAGFDKDKVSPISCPDNVAFDAAGNLWISTDGNVLGSNDGVFRVPTSGPQRGYVKQFLTVPRGAEACGPLISADDQTLFVAVQHPGEIDGATFEAQASTWPHTHDYPRPGVIAAYRKN